MKRVGSFAFIGMLIGVGSIFVWFAASLLMMGGVPGPDDSDGGGLSGTGFRVWFERIQMMLFAGSILFTLLCVLVWLAAGMAAPWCVGKRKARTPPSADQ